MPLPSQQDKDLATRIKDAIRTYDAEIFICGCGLIAFMIDPGDGLVTHLEEQVIH